ncbi:MAG: TIGR02266 family protein [Pseudomonadota bacterium]
MTPNDPARPHDKRIHERIDLKVPIEFRTDDGAVVEAQTLNVSRGGMFIQTPKPLAEGSRAFFRVQLNPQSLQFHLEGEVVWSHRSRERRLGPPKGMGIRFLLSPTQSATTLDGVWAAIHSARL